MLSDTRTTRPNAQQIVEFELKINEWAENELRSNPDNSEKITIATRKICECYSNSLTTLNLESLALKSVPIEIFNLTNLTWLFLNQNQLNGLPSAIGNLANLETLLLSDNQISTLPPEIGNLRNLKSLHLDQNQITAFPPVISNLRNLEMFLLNDNQITELPPEIGNLGNLRKFFLSNNQIASLPSTIGNLRNLEMFLLNDNQITELPPEIGNLGNLLKLFLPNNQIASLPNTISRFTQDIEIDIRDNPISQLPSEISNLTNIQIISSYPHLNRDFSLNQQDITDPALQLENNRILISDFIAPPFASIFDSTNFVYSNRNTSPNQQTVTRSTSQLINRLCDSANFSEAEKSQLYKDFLDLNTTTQISEESTTAYSTLDALNPNSSSQNLTARLGAMLEFFHSPTNQDSQDGRVQRSQIQDNQYPMPNLISSINRFISESASWNQADQEQKKHLARYLLTILSQVYERKEDRIFLEQVEIISHESLADCADRNSLLIFSLANICQIKNAKELNLMNETQPLQLFDYFKNQLLYSNFLVLGQKKVDEIKAGNSSFKEDVEVLLNYLRIFNKEVGASLDLKLPDISNQSYYIGPSFALYQPSSEQIAEFKKIADEFLEGDSSLLHNHLALILTEILYEKSSATNPEILEISFVKNHIQQISNIAQDFLGLFEDYKESREQENPMNEEEYLQKMNEITSLKKQIDKAELKIIFHHSLSQLASNQKPSEEFTPEKLEEIKENFAKFFKDQLKINLNKQTNENEEMAWKISPSTTPFERSREYSTLPLLSKSSPQLSPR